MYPGTCLAFFHVFTVSIFEVHPESITALHHGVRQMNNANFVIQRAPAEAVQKSDIENQTIRAADRSSAAAHWQTI
jgi:hypothetical protein